jgi:hypothetical protein
LKSGVDSGVDVSFECRPAVACICRRSSAQIVSRETVGLSPERR